MSWSSALQKGNYQRQAARIVGKMGKEDVMWEKSTRRERRERGRENRVLCKGVFFCLI